MGIQNILQTAPLFSWDFLMALILVGVFLVLGFFWRKKRMMVVILSLYLARLFLEIFPQGFKNFKQLSFKDINGELLVFWGIFISLFLIFAASGISLKTGSDKKSLVGKKAKFTALKGMIYGIFAAGLFISFSLGLMGGGLSNDLSLIVRFLFASGVSQLAWAGLTLISIMVIK